MNNWFLLLVFIFSTDAWRTIHKRGFLGFIGINEIEKNKKQSIYNAFTKDGIIQGVFIDVDIEGNQIVIPIKHIIQTQKQQWNFNFPTHILTTFIHIIFQTISFNRWNFLGTANTALFQDTQNRSYALYERDLPYEIIFDHKNHIISTGKRIQIPGIRTFSGHSKKRILPDTQEIVIDSIDYDVLKQQVIHNVISGDMKSVIRKTIYPALYHPVVHDFYLIGGNESKLCWVDSPFTICLPKDSNHTGYDFPIGVDSSLPTFFHVGNETFYFERGIAIFHIAFVSETKESYNIYTSIYENLHFSGDIKNISGTYCCIRLDRKNGDVKIFKNRDLISYNLDFPILYELTMKVSPKDTDIRKQLVILRNIDYETKKMNGFIICDRLQIVKKLIYNTKNISGLGEPIILNDGNIPYLLFFVEQIRNELDKTDSNHSFMMKWNLLTGELESLSINISMNIGFHSFWKDSP